MKAIETQYKGYRFRSRLEARWAVFFDALGIKWEYEPEGFELGGIRYLPDFRITTARKTFWVEIKGAAPNVGEIEKLKALRGAAVLFAGDPYRPSEYVAYVHGVERARIEFSYAEDGCEDNRVNGQLAKVFDRDWRVVRNAQVAARQARFEFGASGAQA